MFADNLDQNTLEKNKETASKGDNTTSISLDDDVSWEFKWMQEDQDVIHGPHSSEEMLAWQDSGYFDKGVFVRKHGSNSEFLDGKRIDFELYT